MRRTPLLLLLPLPLALAACAPEDSEDIGVKRLEVEVCATGPTVEGIDVSDWQGDVDWAAVKASGIEFATTKATEGRTFTADTFARNWAGMKAAGIIRSAYHWVHPSNDPIAEADHFVDTVNAAGGWEPTDLPPVIDVEDDDGLGPDAVASAFARFTARVEERTGRKPIVYTANWFWSGYAGSSDALLGYPLWVANYGNDCPIMPAPWTSWVMWQYSDSGRVPGIAGNVDRNVWNGDLASLQAFINPVPVCGDGFCGPGEVAGLEAACEADCPVCQAVPPIGRTIEETDVCATLGGETRFLRQVDGAGSEGHLVWTHTTTLAEAANYAKWDLAIAEEGDYAVAAYVDSAYAQSKQAVYQVRHAGEQTDVTADQTSVNGWLDLGTFHFAQGGDQWIRVDDNTGEAEELNVQLVFDAVRLTRMGPDGQPLDPDELGGSGDHPGGEDGEDGGGCAVIAGGTGGGGGAGVILLGLAISGLSLAGSRRRALRAAARRGTA